MEEAVSRYASALVSIAKEEGKLESYKLAVLSVKETFASNPELLKFLKSYFVSIEDKNKVIDDLTKEGVIDKDKEKPEKKEESILHSNNTYSQYKHIYNVLLQ